MQLIHDKFICLQLTWSTCSAGCISELRRARGDLHELMQQVNQLQNRSGSTLETLRCYVHDMGALFQVSTDFAATTTNPQLRSPWGQQSYALVLAQPSYLSAHRIYTPPPTQHHLQNTIYTTSSTQHHLHYIIHTTPIYTTSSHTSKFSTWSTAILPLLPHSY